MLPAYREAVFESLRAESARTGHQFELWVSPATPDFARRGTEGFLEWARLIPVKKFAAWFGGLEWQNLPWRDVFSADVIIVPDSARTLSNVFVLIVRRLIHKPVLTWGHGVNFQPNQLSRKLAGLRSAFLHLANGWLVYTEACVPPLLAAGFNQNRIALTENAIDTHHAADLHPQHAEIHAFRAVHGLGDAPCVVFLGSWYTRKRPEWVMQLGETLRSQVPQAQILVIGGGDGLQRLQSRELPWLKLLGPLHGRDKFVALATARCLVVSGVAGLNLLDAMAVGLPVVVPRRPDHSPEIAYVRDGYNGFVVQDDIERMAEACTRLLVDQARWMQMSEAARNTSSALTVEHMAANLLDYALQAGSRTFGKPTTDR